MSEIGFGKAIKFGVTTLGMVVFRCLMIPQFRSIYLRLMGCRIGQGTIVMGINLINLYRRGFSGLRMGDYCYLGNDVKLDLAEGIILGDHVTLAENVIVLTHLNVGFQDHVLQGPFPSQVAEASIGNHSFIGAGAIILPGATIGSRVFVAAGSVVTRPVEDGVVIAGNPAQVIRKIEISEAATS